MTIKDLKSILDEYPEDSIVMYRHNKYGRVDIDKVTYNEEELLTGSVIKTLTLEATFKEN